MKPTDKTNGNTRKQVMVRISPAAYRKLQRQANAERRPLGTEAGLVIERALEQEHRAG